MADHFVSVADLPTDGEKFDSSRVSKFSSLSLIVGGIGAVVSWLLLLGVFGDFLRDRYAYSYLFAFSVTFSIVMGGLFWVLLHHAINAGWGIAVRRIWEGLARLIPLLFLFALPFFLPSVQDPPLGVDGRASRDDCPHGRVGCKFWRWACENDSA